MAEKIKVGILGATGYVGSTLLSILLGHSGVSIDFISSRSSAGKLISDEYPKFLAYSPLKLLSIEEAQMKEPNCVFSCLPHKNSAELLLPFIKKGCVVIDLAADFRLNDINIYRKYYDNNHPAPHLLKKAVYALPEIYASKIKKANIIGNPGCYPTSILLPLFPLIKNGLISTKGIIADSKSGTSGGGKGKFPHCETNEDFRAYNIGNTHRHLSEINEQLSFFAEKKSDLLFTPHLLPQKFGILSTIYCDLAKNTNENDIRMNLETFYSKKPFVKIRKELPCTNDVVGTNMCHIGLAAHSGKLIIISVIDNLIKGASGMAVQNMNIRFGFDEKEGLL